MVKFEVKFVFLCRNLVSSLRRVLCALLVTFSLGEVLGNCILVNLGIVFGEALLKYRFSQAYNYIYHQKVETVDHL